VVHPFLPFFLQFPLKKGGGLLFGPFFGGGPGVDLYSGKEQTRGVDLYEGGLTWIVMFMMHVKLNRVQEPAKIIEIKIDGITGGFWRRRRFTHDKSDEKSKSRLARSVGRRYAPWHIEARGGHSGDALPAGTPMGDVKHWNNPNENDRFQKIGMRSRNPIRKRPIQSQK